MQNDNFWKAKTEYAAALQDPNIRPAEFERLRRHWEVLAKHWPYSRTVEEAERAEAQSKCEKFNIDVWR